MIAQMVFVISVIPQCIYARVPSKITSGEDAARAKPPYSEMSVITGTNSLLPSQEARAYRVKDVKIHERYIAQTKTGAVRYDIAVITLRKKIEEDQLQKNINLPTRNTPSNVIATVTGWGRTSANSKLSTILQKVRIPLLSADDCFANGVRVVASQIYGLAGSGIGTCHGDSRGPLVYNNAVVGVLSTSGPCGKNYPDTYTRVYSHLNFIKSAMSQV